MEATTCRLRRRFCDDGDTAPDGGGAVATTGASAGGAAAIGASLSQRPSSESAAAWNACAAIRKASEWVNAMVEHLLYS